VSEKFAAMATIQVNYDLSKPAGHYDGLFRYLSSFNRWTRVLDSMWIIRTTKSEATVRDELMGFVDSNDRVVVLDVTDDCWAANFTSDSTNWMYSNMRRAFRLAA
jgi:hypothetical protein